MNGRFITLEGGEGAGKSTQMAAIGRWINAHGHEAVLTREPGGTELGEAIRTVLMGTYDMPMPAFSELLLMFAARAAHLQQVIEPALARGAWVVSDRFTDASYAYQGAARALGARPVALLEQLVQGERRPDRVLLFDVPAQAGLARRKQQGDTNRFDGEAQAFHERVNQAYRDRAGRDPGRYVIIDACQNRATIFAEIQQALEALL